TQRGDTVTAVDRAGRDLGQERLVGHVGARVDDDDRRLPPAEPLADATGRVEADGSAAEHDDAGHLAGRGRGRLLGARNLGQIILGHAPIVYPHGAAGPGGFVTRASRTARWRGHRPQPSAGTASATRARASATAALRRFHQPRIRRSAGRSTTAWSSHDAPTDAPSTATPTSTPPTPRCCPTSVSTR